MFRPKRQGRYEDLLKAGFQPGEARSLSKVSGAGAKAPYFQKMVASRRGLYQNAKRNGWTKIRFVRAIQTQYGDRGVSSKDVWGSGRDVWALLRSYERQKVKEYESPWKKRVEPKTKTAAKKPVVFSSHKDMIKNHIKKFEKMESQASEKDKVWYRNEIAKLQKRLEEENA